MRDSKSGHRNSADEADKDRETDVEDVFDSLKADHRRVEELFAQFEEADKRKRVQIAEDVLRELTVHALLEEELVYPAVREVLEEEDLVDEAIEEHHVVKLLIKELHKMKPGDERYATKLKVLGELVRHHVEEEENEIFPQAEEAGLDAGELSQAVAVRKAKLLEKLERGGKTSSSSRRRKAA